MNTLLSRAFFKNFAFAKWLPWSIAQLIVVLILILGLSSCGDKAKSQEPFNVSVRENPQLTNQISEVSPPSVIQELRRSLEVYRPQVKILAPKSNETLQDDTVSVQFEVKDLPIFQDSQLKLGPHLQVILDNQPYVTIYDAKKPLVLSNLSAGTHTLRVFASRPWDESFKNEGAYAQVTFNVFTQSDENNPSSQPLLTYSSPQGNFGAEPILLDFYLTNAPLQVGGKDILKNEIGDWRIRCTINDESFILERWESIYLKGFKQGKNWVKLDFLNGQGQIVKNIFNSTIRSITYEPKGQDTLDKIFRGELAADQVRGIIDPNYVAKITKPVEAMPTPTVIPIEPTPEQLKQEKPEIPEIEPLQTPNVTQPTESKEPGLQQPGKLKKGVFFKRRNRTVISPLPQPSIEPDKSETPDLPEIITPAPEINPENIETPEITPTPEVTIPATKIPQSKKSRFSKYFQPLNQTPVIESPQTEDAIAPSDSLEEQFVKEADKVKSESSQVQSKEELKQVEENQENQEIKQ